MYNVADSVLSSSSSEQRWVSHLRKTISKEHIAIVGVPSCVFSVPKTLIDENPNAYAPQKVGIGPYHHLRPHLYKMQRWKLAAVKRQLNPDQLPLFQSLFVDKFKQIEPNIRACYDKYLDLDGDILAWVVALDGLFLFDLISRKCGLHLGDVMMLENQLPLFVLEEIRKGVRGSSVSEDDDIDLYNVIREFCGAYSPLMLNEQHRFQCINSLHLLDYMYHLIVNNRGIPDLTPQRSRSRNSSQATQKSNNSRRVARKRKSSYFKHADEVNGVANIASTFLKSGATKKDFTFMRNLPWDMISDRLKKLDEKSSIVEEIEFPTVSCLCKNARVAFCPRQRGGIRDIKYDRENRTFYLPILTLNKHSEIILRNLVAYEAEAKIGSCSFELAEYVDLMCGLIDTAEDAKLLRDNGIINGDLGDDQIAKIFNGISKSEQKAKNKSDLSKTIDRVNHHYNNVWKVKAYTFVKIHINALWMFLTFLSSMGLMWLLILQAFCQVYGCSRFFE